MRINKNTHHTKRNIIILSIIGLIAVGSVTAWYFLKSGAQQPGENTVNYDPATDEQQSAGQSAKEAFNKAHYDTDNNDENADNTTKKDVELLISSINQNESTLTIATSIEVVDDGGVCELKLSREGSETVTAQVKAFKITTYSACEDFNVDVSGLEKGEWNAQVDYISDTVKGTTSAKVDVK